MDASFASISALQMSIDDQQQICMYEVQICTPIFLKV